MTETVERTGPADIVRRLAALGYGTEVDLSHVRPFRLSTLSEMLLLREVTVSVYGISPGEFAENGWGFPYIPIPVDRSPAPGVLVLAPESATMECIGHPIFWIDPELTAPTKAEETDLAAWSVRMFYLIMAFGLWDTTDFTWYDAPSAKGVRWNRADYENYRKQLSSSLDSVRYTARDLRIDYEDVVRSADLAVAKARRITEREWRRYRAEQITGYRDALSLLREDGPYARIEGQIAALSTEIGRRVHRGGTISEFVTPAYRLKDDLVDLLDSFERLIVLLSTPVLREVAVDVVTYAKVTTTLRAYTEKLTDGGYEREADEILDRMFSADALADARSFATFHEWGERVHMEAWRRMKVAAVNYVRSERGEAPISSWVELQIIEETEATLPGFDLEPGVELTDEELERLFGER